MELLGRGVYRAQYLSSEGLPVLIAIDHASRKIEEAIISRQDDPMHVQAALWRMLDARDPEFARPKAQGIRPTMDRVVALLPLCTTLALLRLATL